MHTTNFKVDGQDVIVHHDGDWSGDAIVCLPDGKEVRIPGPVLIAIGHKAAVETIRDQIVDLLEDL